MAPRGRSRPDSTSSAESTSARSGATPRCWSRERHVDGAKESLNKSWQDGTSDWTGDAKEAAQGANKEIADNAGKLSEALGRAHEDVRAVGDDVKTNVTTYAQKVLDLYGDGTIGELTQTNVDDLIKAAEEFPGAIEEMNAALEEVQNKSWWDHLTDFMMVPFSGVLAITSPISALLGIHFASTITEANLNSELQKITDAETETLNKLSEFITAYDEKANAFHEQGRTAGEYVQNGYNALLQHLGEGLGDAFAKPGGNGEGNGEGQGEGQPPGGDQTGASGDPGGGGGGGQTGGGGGGGMPPGGGGGGMPPGGGGGGMPPGGAGGGAPGGPDDAAKPGDVENPVTGEQAEINPETGEPYPIDPETGEAVKDGAERETLSVEQGDRKLDLVAPNEKGEMDISVTTGDGEPKDFKLDFGNESAEPGVGGEGGAASPGGQPGGQPGGAQDFGPEGAAGAGGAGAGEEQVYTPDEDGKIRIEEDGLKITAEQPDGPDGPTTVTVDDGNGEPTTYTLGEGNGTGNGETSGSGAGAGGMRPAGLGGDSSGESGQMRAFAGGAEDGPGEPGVGSGGVPGVGGEMSGGASGEVSSAPGAPGVGGEVPSGASGEVSSAAGEPGVGGSQSGDLGAAAADGAGGAGLGGAFQGDIAGGEVSSAPGAGAPGVGDSGAGDSGAMQGDLGAGSMTAAAADGSDATGPAANDGTSPAARDPVRRSATRSARVSPVRVAPPTAAASPTRRSAAVTVVTEPARVTAARAAATSPVVPAWAVAA
ncbi:hypothetical protein [Saccharomonospora sp. CUA-673]|uniref:hypothetical protein n=1 Tax=Saccharomonospora sp. CUA-673 TaxID=1904969 RepID=UPI0016513497|nr:hypothetical protein [Saccharomonospora sp. CUA-673]